MHERTQRAVARLMFVFCCAVPTSIVFAMILVSWTPWYQSRKLAELTYALGRETGLEFEIGRCDRIAPGKYVLENVRVSDPDSRQPVATIRLIDYFHDDHQVAVILHQPQFQSAGLGHAWTMLHERLISRPARTVLPITITATDASILSRTGSMPPMIVRADVRPEKENVRMIVEAEHPTHPLGPRLRVDLFRDRDQEIPTTKLVLSTEGTALPCSALAEYAPAIKSLGRDAEFRGVMECNETPNGWSYDLKTSSFTNLNLSDLTDHLPHRVVGIAELHLRRCLIDPGESVDLVGSIESSKPSNLRIKTPLLLAIREHLGMRIDEGAFVANPNGIECDLTVDFEIRDQTMTLTGIRNNVILYSRGRPIALAPLLPLDADRITATLAPPSRWLATWNQVLLPSAPTVSAGSAVAPQIRTVRNLDAEPTIWQQ